MCQLLASVLLFTRILFHLACHLCEYWVVETSLCALCSVRLLEDALRWGSADLFSPSEMARDQATAEAQVSLGDWV